MGRIESESVGHTQSDYCEGQKEVVTVAHNRCNHDRFSKGKYNAWWRMWKYQRKNMKSR